MSGNFILEFPSINSPILPVTHARAQRARAMLSSAHSAAAVGRTLIFMTSAACMID